MTPQQKVKKLITKIGMTDPKVVDITTQNLGKLPLIAFLDIYWRCHE